MRTVARCAHYPGAGVKGDTKAKQQRREAAARYRARHPDAIRARRQAYDATHREQNRERSRRLAARKRELRKAERDRLRQLAATPGTPEYVLETNRLLLKLIRRIEAEQLDRERARERYRANRDSILARLRALNATPRGQFELQRRRAKRRGIPFLLTFNKWLKVWKDSGHFHQRGKRPGQYVMARRDDVGPYTVGNVYVTTIEQNTRDAFANGRHG